MWHDGSIVGKGKGPGASPLPPGPRPCVLPLCLTAKAPTAVNTSGERAPASGKPMQAITRRRRAGCAAARQCSMGSPGSGSLVRMDAATMAGEALDEAGALAHYPFPDPVEQFRVVLIVAVSLAKAALGNRRLL